ncbi:General transcription and DNA repair factor IIH subunit TFB5 [Glycine max]|nr:General transcription and DNA repair factor IIH subunit TFB5 [Glycine max]
MISFETTHKALPPKISNPIRRHCSSPSFHLSLSRRGQARRKAIYSDIPMAQYIINMNASLPASDKFIIHILDNTHMFVQPHVEQMIRSRIAKFREDNTYVKPN